MEFTLPGRTLVNSGIVTGDHRIKAQGKSAVENRFELDLLVAPQARIGGSPLPVFVHEIVDNVSLESLGKIPDIEGDVEQLGDSASIEGIFHRATATGAGAKGIARARQSKMHPDHLMAGVFRPGSSDSAVHAATHGRNHFHPLSVEAGASGDLMVAPGHRHRVPRVIRLRAGRCRPLRGRRQ